MTALRLIGLVLGICLAPTLAWPGPLTEDRAAYRNLYQQLVEINTTLSAGSCTQAAQAMAARLKSAGLPDKDIHVIVPPEWPKQGNLVATLHGTAPDTKALLLLAHIDVVEANREDWERDPFTLIEEDGYFYGRGTADDCETSQSEGRSR